MYRAAAESLRNVEHHAQATHVSVGLRSTANGVELEVVDDGAGSTAEERRQRANKGHVGLSLLAEFASGSGGASRYAPASGDGTTVTLELPGR